LSAATPLLEGILPGGAVRAGGDPVGGVLPEATVAPSSEAEVAEVLRAASAGGFGVVPVGGGTDLGPRPPRGPFVVLSTRALTALEGYEPADLTMSAGAGSTLQDIDALTGPHGQWLPFDPPHAPARTLGGIAASGARGPLASSYGPPRDHILGLTLVTGDGRVLRLGGRVMKNVAGFDLVRLTVGSRGTLGVVVAVSVRLFPRPARDLALVLRAPTLDDLVDAARAVATAPVVPASVVLVSAAAAATVDDPASATRPALVVRLHGAPEAVVADGARLQARVGRSVEPVEGAWAAALFTELRDHASTGEMVVRLSAPPAALGDALHAAFATPGVAAVAADVMAGRVRVAAAASAAALAGLSAAAERLGGSCLVERAPADILSDAVAPGGSARVAALSSALKERFDPRGVLSPGRFVA
jgi:glycolate dehydrogenase FAD-binding subunit